MKPPPGMTFENITARNEARFRVEVESVVHLCPPKGSGLTACCDESPFALSVFDRMTLDPALVTCRGQFGRQDGGSDG